MLKFHSLLAAGLLAALPWTAAAHGDGKGEKKAVTKEQKAWGIAGEARAVKRTIEVTMTDNMRFSPEVISLKQGDTVRLVVKNGGKMLHELVIGTKQELDEHAELMAKFPNMEHDEPYMTHVAPGRKGEVIWTFNRPGEFMFACLIPGHYQAGMVGRVNVTAR
jgi:uncharacterized cupredoxin-like copper-binding protein